MPNDKKTTPTWYDEFLLALSGKEEDDEEGEGSIGKISSEIEELLNEFAMLQGASAEMVAAVKVELLKTYGLKSKSRNELMQSIKEVIGNQIGLSNTNTNNGGGVSGLKKHPLVNFNGVPVRPNENFREQIKDKQENAQKQKQELKNKLVNKQKLENVQKLENKYQPRSRPAPKPNPF